MVCHHLADLQREDCFPDTVCLDQPTAVSQRMLAFVSEQIGVRLTLAEVKTSYRARMHPAGICSKGDVVLIKNPLGGANICGGEIWFHAELADECWSLVSIWYAHADDQPFGVAKWKKVLNPTLVPTDNILAVCICKMSGECVQTLIPYQLRNRPLCR
jgi:hypothetical protein